VRIASRYASALGKNADCQTVSLARGEVPGLLALHYVLTETASGADRCPTRNRGFVLRGRNEGSSHEVIRAGLPDHAELDRRQFLSGICDSRVCRRLRSPPRARKSSGAAPDASPKCDYFDRWTLRLITAHQPELSAAENRLTQRRTPGRHRQLFRGRAGEILMTAAISKTFFARPERKFGLDAIIYRGCCRDVALGSACARIKERRHQNSWVLPSKPYRPISSCDDQSGGIFECHVRRNSPL
jgi:hypothetical protein